jgi:hypothetical protein
MEWYALAIALLVCFIATDALAIPVTAKLVSCEANPEGGFVGIYEYDDRKFLRLCKGTGCPLEIQVQDDL